MKNCQWLSPMKLQFYFLQITGVIPDLLAYLARILFSIGRERVWLSLAMPISSVSFSRQGGRECGCLRNMLCDMFILKIPSLSSASLIHLLSTACRRCCSGLFVLHPEAYLVSFPLSIGREKEADQELIILSSYHRFSLLQVQSCRRLSSSIRFHTECGSVRN